MTDVCNVAEETKPAEPSDSTKESSLTIAQRARIERNRLRARALQDARLIKRPHAEEPNKKTLINAKTRVVDSGGGFLIEETNEEPVICKAQPSAPIVNPREQPKCLECEQLFPQSYLFDTFDYNVCDNCRDDEDAHSLITRTEAKSDYLLQDCDLDKRPPPLKCIRRRNPHRSHYSDMRLYLRAQVEDRALEVWGTPENLDEEKERRKRKREQTKHAQSERRMRALRMDVRSSLFDRSHKTHAHTFGEEAYDEADDVYTRTCNTCGHVERYEKL